MKYVSLALPCCSREKDDDVVLRKGKKDMECFEHENSESERS